jgi:hypothetical protein
MARRLLGWVAWPLLAAALAAVPVEPPRSDASVRFAVIGDSGSGAARQYELANRLAAARSTFPFAFVLMLGDNIYGSDAPKDLERKFERPYKALRDAGVQFFAALGNHDGPIQRSYPPFNMGGRRYYSFSRGAVAFFVMDTSLVDRAQLDWLEREVSASDARWKIAYGHHPIYSSGKRHGPALDLRALVEPLFVKGGIDVVLAGHEHFYERIHPQRGIYYFTSGAAGKLRKGDIEPSALTAAGYDRDLSFILMEVAGDELHFQVVSRTGDIVDRGTLSRPSDPPAPTAP